MVAAAPLCTVATSRNVQPDSMQQSDFFAWCEYCLP